MIMRRSNIVISVILVFMFFSPLFISCVAPTVEKSPDSPSKSVTPSIPDIPSDVIQWHEAKNHVGERTTVCGPVVSTKWASTSGGSPTFLNIGNAYPDTNRFTVIIWKDYRKNFKFLPETYYQGKTICVTGLITEYKRVPEIEVRSQDEIEVK
jgi:DNA/RNA endonuclease YhcR with UshA esterase domain